MGPYPLHWFVPPGGTGEIFLMPPSIGLSQVLLNGDHHAVYHEGCPRGPGGETLRRHGDAVTPQQRRALCLRKGRHRSGFQPAACAALRSRANRARSRRCSGTRPSPASALALPAAPSAPLVAPLGGAGAAACADAAAWAAR